MSLATTARPPRTLLARAEVLAIGARRAKAARDAAIAEARAAGVSVSALARATGLSRAGVRDAGARGQAGTVRSRT